jgi:hypothetical protein
MGVDKAMKTEILTLESKEDALLNLKAHLCRPDRRKTQGYTLLLLLTKLNY